jgi:4-amino-4-deoxy-L-arabinose transferase-like glycosyltransferase
MMNVGLADQKNLLTDEQGHIQRATVLKLFLIIAAVSFILRIAYAGHLYEDDGLWFTVGEELGRGKALYREIYFDKPPGLPLVYALLFWIFGAHILTIRLFTIAFSTAISGVLYLFGSRLYSKRVGLLAAVMFAVFSTTYPHLQMLSTDFLMVMPYTAGAYLMVRSRRDSRGTNRKRSHNGWLAVGGGALAGVAFQINPKALFDLAFFAIFLIASRRWNAADHKRSDKPNSAEPAPGVIEAAGKASEGRLGASGLFALAVAGFLASSIPFIAYIAATRSLSTYWFYVWDWGSRYGRYYSARKILGAALNSGSNYLALNDTLLIGLVFVSVAAARQMLDHGGGADQATGASFKCAGGTPALPERVVNTFRADMLLLIWFAVSFAGVMVGGRFYAHYFLQTLPSLCLIGARGLTGIISSLSTRGRHLRRTGIALLVIGFTFTLVRFHGRGVLLAIDWARGTTSELNANWYHNVRDHEERMVAAVVRDLPDGADAADRLGLEAIRAGGPRTRQADEPSDYLFVWGYRPEVYFWSGLLPASRFLSTQPLTGVPADIHYFTNEYRSLLDEADTAPARAQLVRDLEETQPKYIVDEIGFFNGDLAILKYSELQGIMDKYKSIGSTGRFLLYVRKDLTKKYLLRHSPK